MKQEQSCQIWKLAADKGEYERLVTLLSTTSRNQLDQDVFNDLLRSKAVEQVQGEPSALVIHDPCSIRKPYAKKLEKLDKVLDLEGNIVDGYRTFSSVLVAGSSLALLSCHPYSQKETSRLDAEKHLSNKEVSFSEIRQISKTLKADFPERCITHLMDREADDSAYFELIDKELNDLFIFRLKTNRNSDVAYLSEETGRERKVKLHHKPFENEATYIFDKFVYKGKCYQQVQAKMSWERQWLGTGQYTVIRVELFQRTGRRLFAKPMMLVTNYSMQGEETVLHVFQTYLKRSKIEGVFKFLKNELGWEDFQVRNFLAIKNIILLGFFVGAYFYEREPELVSNPLVVAICNLAKNKGVISKHFFMQGLKILAHYKAAIQLFKEHNLSQEQVEELLNMLE